MKLIRIIIFVLLFNSLIGFLVFLNIKMTFGTPQGMKDILVESDAYNIVAGAIRENIVAQNSDLNSGNLLEVLNEKVGPAGLQTMTEDFVDQMYGQNGEPTDLVFKYDLLQEKLGPDIQLPVNQSYSFEKFLPAKVDVNAIFITSALSLLAALMLHIMLIGRTLKQKLKWLGYNFLITSLGLLGLTLLLFIFVPEITKILIDSIAIENQKIANSVVKVIYAIIDTQKPYYLLELGLVFAASVVLFVLTKFAKDEPTVIGSAPGSIENLRKN